MRVVGIPAVVVVVLLVVQLGGTEGYNITKILGQHPSLSSFNHYLSLTHLAAEINRRRTITVCALDNSAMADITSKGYSIYTIRNILSLHVLVDYYGAKKLHQISNRTTVTATMFQATGMAPGNSGYVNITDLPGGKVGFNTADNGGEFNSFFVKSIIEKPYNISILQISNPLSSSEADAPMASPTTLNLPSVLSSKGCKAFAALLTSTNTTKTLNETIDAAGLTLFCVSDAAVNAFMPKYRALTAANKRALLLYHAVPEYNSMGMLQSTNAVMSTLATDKPTKFDFTVQTDGNSVTLDTEVVTGKITGTLIDEEPLSIYKVDKVLLPKELFKAEKAQSPESSDDDGSVADQSNGSFGINGYGFATLVVTVICAGTLF